MLVSRDPMRPFVVFALTIVSALGYGHAFPTSSIRLLAWVALAPLFVAITRVRTVRVAMIIAWLWTVVAAWELNDWFPRAVSEYFLQPAIVGYVFFIGVSTFAALPYMAFAAWLRTVGPLPRFVYPLVVGAAWTAAEYLRAAGPLGDPWGLAAYSQARVGWLVQLASLAGVFGTSFVLAVVNAAVARPSGAGVLAAACTVAIAAARGLSAGTLHVEPASAMPVSVVQTNLDVGSQWREELYGRNLDAYLVRTREALRRHRPALVVWPESAMTFFVEDEPTFRVAIQRDLATTGADLVAGGPRKASDGPQDRYYNSAFLVRPDGRIPAIYDKQLLLPFAEYVPTFGVDVLRRRFGRVREFSPGATATLLPTAAGLAGVVTCNESLFSDPSAARVRAGAEILIALANDSWLGDARYAEQALDMAIFRAVEQRRYVVRASTSGPSAIIDPSGRVVASTGFASAEVLDGMVERRVDRTFYGRFGDVFAWLCFAIAAIASTRRPSLVVAPVDSSRARGHV